MTDIVFGGGNSSIELNRTAKGDFTWGMKLYFLGSDMRAIKQVLANILKTKAILEVGLNQEIIPTEEMSAYMAGLHAQIQATIRKKVAEKTEPEGEEDQGE